jgi:hypothetical protein
MGYHHDVLEIDDRHIPTNREDMWHNWNLGAKKPSGDFVSVQPWCGKRHLFLSFPYVCPEPVLAKCSFLYINGSKMPFFAGWSGLRCCLIGNQGSCQGRRLRWRALSVRVVCFATASGGCDRVCPKIPAEKPSDSDIMESQYVVRFMKSATLFGAHLGLPLVVLSAAADS